jgi:hypothetical protein
MLAVATGRGRIVIIEGRNWRYIDNARTGDYPALTWSSSGWLFYGADAHHIGAWRPGQPARTLGVRVAKFVSAAAD